MRVTATAPGKVFVVGEYAVVTGGAAIVAAVNRRVSCRLEATPGTGRLHARHGAAEHCTEIVRDDGPSAPREVRFLVTAVQHGARELGLADVDVSVETQSDLDDARGKRGLGGSAAVTAAIVAGMHCIAGRALDVEGLRARARIGVAAHRAAQGGGSGADVVAATVGGVVWTVGPTPPRGAAAAPGERTPSFERLQLPPGLNLEVVATRRPALTAARVERYLVLREGNEVTAAVLREWQRGMEESVEEMRRCCREGDSAGALRALRFAGRQLEALAPITGIRILTPELRRAVSAVGDRGAAKASGAGGGDCAIALVNDVDRNPVRRTWEDAGLEALGVEIDPQGACAVKDEEARWQ